MKARHITAKRLGLLMLAGVLAITGWTALRAWRDPTAGLNATECLARGNEHLDRHEFEQAVTFYTAAIQRKERNVAALHKRAVAYLGMRQFGKALEDLAFAIRFSQGSRPESFFIRARLHELQGRTDKAIADASRAIDLDPRHKHPYLLRARLYEATGQSDLAEHDLEQAERLAKQ